MKRKRTEKINAIILALLILGTGYFSGYTLGYFRAADNAFPEIQTMPELNPGIATLRLMEVKNGQLIGETAGQKMRIAYNTQNILELEKNALFSVPIADISLKDYYPARSVPADAMFMASREGRYYYSVFEKSAYRISEKNRVFFGSAAEAEKNGYKRK